MVWIWKKKHFPFFSVILLKCMILQHYFVSSIFKCHQETKNVPNSCIKKLPCLSNTIVHDFPISKNSRMVLQFNDVINSPSTRFIIQPISTPNVWNWEIGLNPWIFQFDQWLSRSTKQPQGFFWLSSNCSS